MEPGCTAKTDFNRSLSATPVDSSKTTARAAHARRPSRRLEAGATSLEGNLGCGGASDIPTADTIDSKWSSAAGTATSGSNTEALSGLATDTGATNLYPTRGTVSTKRGLSAESFKAPRSFLTAVFNPTSNSTNVSLGQSFSFSSSRVRTTPCRSNSSISNWKGFSCNRMRNPFLVSWRLSKSASKTPKRAIRRCAVGPMTPSRHAFKRDHPIMCQSTE
jgi:hypothetical protein